MLRGWVGLAMSLVKKPFDSDPTLNQALFDTQAQQIFTCLQRDPGFPREGTPGKVCVCVVETLRFLRPRALPSLQKYQ